jgi:SH3-like domain-containing protein
MTGWRRISPPLNGLLLALGLSFGTVAQSQTMVSIQGSTVNMRAGPGTHNEALWSLGKGYPLKVVGRQGRWLNVVDFENDRGWVARSLTGSTPHHIVKAEKANIRRGPGLHFRVVAQARYGELLRTREKRQGWVRVEREDGRTGWVARRLLWGW